MKLLSLPFEREIVHYALPILGQTIVSPILITCDTMLVGHILGTTDLAALTIGSTIVSALINIFIFIVFVTNSTVARKIGAGKIKEGFQFGISSIWLALGLGLLVATALYFTAPYIVNTFFASAAAKQGAIDYIHGMLIALPADLVFMATIGIMRGNKRTRFPTVVSACMIVVNVPLNLLFLLVFHLGIFGSGLATSITLLIAAGVMSCAVFQQSHELHVSRKPDLRGIKNSFVEGLPVLFRTVMLWVAIILLMNFVSSYGDAATAGFQVTDSIWTFGVYFIDAIGESINSLISTEIGSQNFTNAKKILHSAKRVGLLLASFISEIFLIFGWWLPYFYTTDDTVHIYAFVGIIEAAIIIYHSSYAFVMDGAMIAAKDTKFMAFSTGLSSFIYIIFALIFDRFLPKNPVGFGFIIFTYDGILLGCRALFASYRTRNDRWLNVAKSSVQDFL